MRLALLCAIAFISLACHSNLIERKEIINSKEVKSGNKFQLPPYDVQRPKIKYEPKILYPDEYRDLEKNVKVIVFVLVDVNGNVSDARIVKSSDERFNKYALKYAYDFKFEPGKLGRVNIPLGIALEINFISNQK